MSISHKFIQYFFVTLSFLCNFNSFANEPKNTGNYDLITMQKNGELNKLPVVKLHTSHDSAYNKPMDFEGYPLVELLALQNSLSNLKSTEMLYFIAKDGFKMGIPVDVVLRYKPILAFRDASLPATEDWLPFKDGSRTLTPAPFYLVWDDSKNTVAPEYYPFQTIQISFATFKEVYGASFPQNKSVVKGFEIYQANCSACHSVNLAGGTLGLEMNVPKNFTEYLTKEFFMAYVKNPQDFRANAKMPSKADISSKKVTEVWNYLGAMKSEKICKTAASCQDIVNKK